MTALKLVLLTAVLTAGVAQAQATFTCQANVPVPPLARGDGAAEQGGDIVIVCTGGIPTSVGQPVPQVNFQFFGNTNVTNRILATGFNDALMLVDEPAPASQQMCNAANGVCSLSGTGNGVGTYNGSAGRPNVFQGRPGNPNQISFLGIPVDPPGVGNNRVFRFTNFRFNAIGLGSSAQATPIQVSMSINGSISVAINNPIQTVAFVQNGVSVSTRNIQTGASGLTQLTARFAEGFAASFKTRLAGQGAQNTPGTFLPGSESGFYNPQFPNISGRGDLGLAGLADSGTRLLARMTGVPQGVTITAPLTINTAAGGVARLTMADFNGAGVYEPSGSTTLNNAQGNVSAVYEITNADPNSLETVDIPFGFSYAAGASLNGLSLSLGFAPVNTSTTTDATSPIPRFNNLVAFTASTIRITTTALPSATPGSSYLFTMQSTGGSGGNGWLASGLPFGLSISSQGTITGAPATNAAGVYTVTFTVTDSNGAQATAQLPLVVGSALSITTNSLPNATTGVGYLQSLAVSGGLGPYLFSLTTSQSLPSALPAGINLTTQGVLTGTPTQSGNFAFTVVVSDATGAQATKRFTLSVGTALNITSNSPLPTGTAGTFYSYNFTSTGGISPLLYTFVGSGIPGLSLATNGTLSGTPTTPGLYNINVRVTDANQNTVVKPFQVTFNSPAPLLQVSRTQIDLTALQLGNPPPPESLNITAPSASAYQIQIDGGIQGLAAPGWLSVRPLTGTTPSLITISVNQAGLPPGTVTGRLRISAPQSAGQQPVDVTVRLTVAAASPVFDVAPSSLRFSARASSPGVQQQSILLRNTGGGGSILFSASVVGNSPWLSLTGGSGGTVAGVPSLVTARVNTQGLAAGVYRETIAINGNGKTFEIPVSLLVAAPGSILGVETTGTRFAVREGAGTAQNFQVKIFNRGDPNSALTWVADLQSGSEWLNLSPVQGVATPGQPGTLTLTPALTVASFPPGSREALVRITAPGAQNSPQYFVAVLDVLPAASAVEPELPSAPLVAIAAAARSGPILRSIRLTASSSVPVAFQASAVPSDGGNWLRVTPASGNVSTAVPVSLDVVFDPTGLAVGVYKGKINVVINGVLRAKDATFIVSTQPAADPNVRTAPGCTPSRLIIAQGGLPDNFSTPAGWPASLVADLYDECANHVTDASVIASFGVGEPIRLAGDGNGLYTGTWRPANAAGGRSITLDATAAPLAPATLAISGTVTANVVPSLNKNGVVNNLYAVAGAGLAPGTVAAIYGTGLAGGDESPGVLPLPTAFKGTSILIGGNPVPLFFVSPGQVNIQVPFELPLTEDMYVIGLANGKYTDVEIVRTTAVSPGVVATADGRLIAQHPASGGVVRLVDNSFPARPGETLAIYLVGMGAAQQTVATGALSPVPPDSVVRVQPTVTVDGQNAAIAYAGLTPGGIGLYQINFVVPDAARTGNAQVVVKQGPTATANTTTMPVVR